MDANATALRQALPPTAELRVGVSLSPVQLSVVAQQTSSVAVFVFGAHEGQCPQGTANGNDGDGDDSSTGNSSASARLSAMHLATYSAEDGEWVKSNVYPAFELSVFAYQVRRGQTGRSCGGAYISSVKQYHTRPCRRFPC